MPSGLTVALPTQTTLDTSKSPAGARNDPARVEHAAKQFEALMISQMMKSVREGEESGPMAEDTDQASSSAMQLAEEQFAQALASRGGLGLASIMAKGLAKGSSNAQNDPTPHPTVQP